MKRPAWLLLFGLAPTFTGPLWQWLSEHGAEGCVEGCRSQGLRGLAVNKKVKKGEVILQVPLSRTLADGCGGTGVPVQAGPIWAKKLPWNVQLALGVLERRADPEWMPFIDSWPEAPLLPKDLEEEELEEAQDEDLEVKAGGTFFWLEDRYEDAREAFEELMDGSFPWTEEDFRWAMAHVWSRCLRLDLDNQKRRLLVPLLDLGNHDSKPSASFEFLSVHSAVCLVALRDMEPNEAVTYSYGEHPNEHFLLYYGFVPSENPHDFVNVSFSKVMSFLPGYDETLDLQEFGGVLLRGKAPDISMLQVLHAVLREAEDDDAGAQARALKAVATVCRGLEAEHATTAEEDEAILEGSELSAGARSLVEWRLSRKRLLRQLRRSMEELSELMASDAKLAERKLRRALGAPPGAPPGGGGGARSGSM